MDFSYRDISKMIDHSLLHPTTRIEDLEAGIQLALAYDVASVCILPYYVPRCAELLAGTDIKTSTTIGFPHGGQKTSTKRFEAEQAIADGCDELDLVANISQVLSGDWNSVREDLQAVIEVAHANQRLVKVIFENCYLNEDHKIRLCELCSELHADWVKTSTGFGTGGATAEDVSLMRLHTGLNVQIKAAGGIRDFDQVLQMRSLGVSRIGTSGSQQLLDECRRRLDLPVFSIKKTITENQY